MAAGHPVWCHRAAERRCCRRRRSDGRGPSSASPVVRPQVASVPGGHLPAARATVSLYTAIDAESAETTTSAEGRIGAPALSHETQSSKGGAGQMRTRIPVP